MGSLVSYLQNAHHEGSTIPFFCKFSTKRSLPCTMIQKKAFILGREGPFHMHYQSLERGGPSELEIRC